MVDGLIVAVPLALMGTVLILFALLWMKSQRQVKLSGAESEEIDYEAEARDLARELNHSPGRLLKALVRLRKRLGSEDYARVVELYLEGETSEARRSLVVLFGEVYALRPANGAKGYRNPMRVVTRELSILKRLPPDDPNRELVDQVIQASPYHAEVLSFLPKLAEHFARGGLHDQLAKLGKALPALPSGVPTDRIERHMKVLLSDCRNFLALIKDAIPPSKIDRDTCGKAIDEIRSWHASALSLKDEALAGLPERALVGEAVRQAFERVRTRYIKAGGEDSQRVERLETDTSDASVQLRHATWLHPVPLVLGLAGIACFLGAALFLRHVQREQAEASALSRNVVRIRTPEATGTGFFVRHDNLLVTNHHVVSSDEMGNQTFDEVIAEVRTAAGTACSFKARVVASVPPEEQAGDIAVLELIEPYSQEHLPVGLEMPRDCSTRAEQAIRVLGHPYGGGIAVSTGEVNRAAEDQLLLTITVDRGNSGSPVVDDRGRVVGVVKSVPSNLYRYGIAVPSSAVWRLIDSTRKR